MFYPKYRTDVRNLSRGRPLRLPLAPWRMKITRPLPPRAKPTGLRRSTPNHRAPSQPPPIRCRIVGQDRGPGAGISALCCEGALDFSTPLEKTFSYQSTGIPGKIAGGVRAWATSRKRVVEAGSARLSGRYRRRWHPTGRRMDRPTFAQANPQRGPTRCRENAICSNPCGKRRFAETTPHPRGPCRWPSRRNQGT